MEFEELFKKNTQVENDNYETNDEQQTTQSSKPQTQYSNEDFKIQQQQYHKQQEHFQKQREKQSQDRQFAGNDNPNLGFDSDATATNSEVKNLNQNNQPNLNQDETIKENLPKEQAVVREIKLEEESYDATPDNSDSSENEYWADMYEIESSMIEEDYLKESPKDETKSNEIVDLAPQKEIENQEPTINEDEQPTTELKPQKSEEAVEEAQEQNQETIELDIPEFEEVDEE